MRFLPVTILSIVLVLLWVACLLLNDRELREGTHTNQMLTTLSIKVKVLETQVNNQQQELLALHILGNDLESRVHTLECEKADRAEVSRWVTRIDALEQWARDVVVWLNKYCRCSREVCTNGVCQRRS